MKEAYESFSAAYRAKTSFEAFEKEFNKGRAYTVQMVCTNKRGDSSSDVEATVVSSSRESKEKKTVKIRFQLIKEEHKWKISSMGN